MKKKEFIGIAYVSLIIIIWGTIGSLIDFLFLTNNFYIEGSINQYSTFLISGIVSSWLGVKYFKSFNGLFAANK